MPVFHMNRSRKPQNSAARHGSPPKRAFLPSNHVLDQQLFDYLIVVDFECTCERDRRTYPNEIIEFPAVLVDVRRGFVDKERSFHTYVKPWRNPKLSAFCTELTGITQDQVDKAPDIQTAVQRFVEWYRETIPRGARAAFATDGPWDFKNFLYSMAVLRDHVSLPTILYEYFDVRTTFARVFNKGDPIKLDAMLRRMKLRFEGSPHSGFDDAYNIARLALEMMQKGCMFHFYIALPLDEEDYHYELEGYPVYRRAEGGSGYITKEHVEEAAKKAFGPAYFSFAAEQAESVEAYRKDPARAAKTGARARGPLWRRRDGGLLEWQFRRRLAVVFILALVLGAALAMFWRS